MGVDLVLEKCAQADDPFLRGLTAFALNFWTGNEAANRRMEDTLDKLAHDDGQGTLTVAQQRIRGRRSKLAEHSATTISFTRPPETISYTQPPELNVKLNATIALARRGSDKVNTGRLAEMLDEAKLRTQFLHEDLNTEQPTPDEGMVVQILVNALKATADLHRQRPEKITPAVRAGVEKLKSHGNAVVNTEAQTALAVRPAQ